MDRVERWRGEVKGLDSGGEGLVVVKNGEEAFVDSEASSAEAGYAMVADVAVEDRSGGFV